MGLLTKVLDGADKLFYIVVVGVILLVAVLSTGCALVSFYFSYLGASLGFIYTAILLMGVLVYFRRTQRRAWKASKWRTHIVIWSPTGAVIGCFYMLFVVLISENPQGPEPFFIVMAASIVAPVFGLIPSYWYPDIDLFD
jgi:hypothetical protein